MREIKTRQRSLLKHLSVVTTEIKQGLQRMGDGWGRDGETRKQSGQGGNDVCRQRIEGYSNLLSLEFQRLSIHRCVAIHQSDTVTITIRESYALQGINLAKHSDYNHTKLSITGLAKNNRTTVVLLCEKSRRT